MLVQTAESGTPAFSFKGGNLLIVREDEQVKVSVKLFSRKGALLAELIDNEWKVNQSQTWDRNYSADALEVKDSSGKIVLQVKALQDRIQIQAILWGEDGYGLALWVEEGQALFQGLKPNVPYNQIIQPMFKYPSESHLGELVTK